MSAELLNVLSHLSIAIASVLLENVRQRIVRSRCSVRSELDVN